MSKVQDINRKMLQELRLYIPHVEWLIRKVERASSSSSNKEKSCILEKLKRILKFLTNPDRIIYCTVSLECVENIIKGMFKNINPNKRAGNHGYQKDNTSKAEDCVPESEKESQCDKASDDFQVIPLMSRENESLSSNEGFNKFSIERKIKEYSYSKNRQHELFGEDEDTHISTSTKSPDDTKGIRISCPISDSLSSFTFSNEKVHKNVITNKPFASFSNSLHPVKKINDRQKSTGRHKSSEYKSERDKSIDEEKTTINIPTNYSKSTEKYKPEIDKSNDTHKLTGMHKSTNSPKSPVCFKSEKHKLAEKHESKAGPQSTEKQQLEERHRSSKNHRSSKKHKSTERSKSTERHQHQSVKKHQTKESHQLTEGSKLADLHQSINKHKLSDKNKSVKTQSDVRHQSVDKHQFVDKSQTANKAQSEINDHSTNKNQLVGKCESIIDHQPDDIHKSNDKYFPKKNQSAFENITSNIDKNESSFMELKNRFPAIYKSTKLSIIPNSATGMNLTEYVKPFDIPVATYPHSIKTDSSASPEQEATYPHSMKTDSPASHEQVENNASFSPSSQNSPIQFKSLEKKNIPEELPQSRGNEQCVKKALAFMNKTNARTEKDEVINDVRYNYDDFVGPASTTSKSDTFDQIWESPSTVTASINKFDNQGTIMKLRLPSSNLSKTSPPVSQSNQNIYPKHNLRQSNVSSIQHTTENNDSGKLRGHDSLICSRKAIEKEVVPVITKAEVIRQRVFAGSDKLIKLGQKRVPAPQLRTSRNSPTNKSHTHYEKMTEGLSVLDTLLSSSSYHAENSVIDKIRDEEKSTKTVAGIYSDPRKSSSSKSLSTSNPSNLKISANFNREPPLALRSDPRLKSNVSVKSDFLKDPRLHQSNAKQSVSQARDIAIKDPRLKDSFNRPNEPSLSNPNYPNQGEYANYQRANHMGATPIEQAGPNFHGHGYSGGLTHYTGRQPFWNSHMKFQSDPTFGGSQPLPHTRMPESMHPVSRMIRPMQLLSIPQSGVPVQHGLQRPPSFSSYGPSQTPGSSAIGTSFTCLMVENLPLYTNSDHIYKFFEEYLLRDIVIDLDPSYQCKGIAYVHFPSHPSAKEAFQNLNGAFIDVHQINLKICAVGILKSAKAILDILNSDRERLLNIPRKRNGPANPFYKLRSIATNKSLHGYSKDQRNCAEMQLKSQDSSSSKPGYSKLCGVNVGKTDSKKLLDFKIPKIKQPVSVPISHEPESSLSPKTSSSLKKSLEIKEDSEDDAELPTLDTLHSKKKFRHRLSKSRIESESDSEGTNDCSSLGKSKDIIYDTPQIKGKRNPDGAPQNKSKETRNKTIVISSDDEVSVPALSNNTSCDQDFDIYNELNKLAGNDDKALMPDSSNMKTFDDIKYTFKNNEKAQMTDSPERENYDVIICSSDDERTRTKALIQLKKQQKISMNIRTESTKNLRGKKTKLITALGSKITRQKQDGNRERISSNTKLEVLNPSPLRVVYNLIKEDKMIGPRRGKKQAEIRKELLDVNFSLSDEQEIKSREPLQKNLKRKYIGPILEHKSKRMKRLKMKWHKGYRKSFESSIKRMLSPNGKMEPKSKRLRIEFDSSSINNNYNALVNFNLEDSLKRLSTVCSKIKNSCDPCDDEVLIQRNNLYVEITERSKLTHPLKLLSSDDENDDDDDIIDVGHIIDSLSEDLSHPNDSQNIVALSNPDIKLSASDIMEIEDPTDEADIEKHAADDTAFEKTTLKANIDNPADETLIEKASIEINKKHTDELEIENPTDKAEIEKPAHDESEIENPDEVEIEKLGEEEIEKPADEAVIEKPDEAEIEKPDDLEIKKPGGEEIEQPADLVEIDKPADKAEIDKPAKEAEIDKPVEEAEIKESVEAEFDVPADTVEIKKPTSEADTGRTTVEGKINNTVNEAELKKLSGEIATENTTDEVDVEKLVNDADFEKLSKDAVPQQNSEVFSNIENFGNSKDDSRTISKPKFEHFTVIKEPKNTLEIIEGCEKSDLNSIDFIDSFNIGAKQDQLILDLTYSDFALNTNFLKTKANLGNSSITHTKSNTLAETVFNKKCNINENLQPCQIKVPATLSNDIDDPLENIESIFKSDLHSSSKVDSSSYALPTSTETFDYKSQSSCSSSISKIDSSSDGSFVSSQVSSSIYISSDDIPEDENIPVSSQASSSASVPSIDSDNDEATSVASSFHDDTPTVNNEKVIGVTTEARGNGTPELTGRAGRRVRREKVSTFDSSLINRRRITRTVAPVTETILWNDGGFIDLFQCDQCTYAGKLRVHHLVNFHRDREVPCYFRKEDFNPVLKDSRGSMYPNAVNAVKLNLEKIPNKMIFDNEMECYLEDDCDYISINRFDFIYHLLEHQPESLPTMFHCRLCNFMANELEGFYDHVASHTGEYRHTCDRCGQKDFSMSSLDLHHQDTHEKQTKQFKSVEMILEEGFPYIYSCKSCFFTQIKKESTEAHILRKHNGRADLVKSNMSRHVFIAAERKKETVQVKAAPVHKVKPKSTLFLTKPKKPLKIKRRSVKFGKKSKKPFVKEKNLSETQISDNSRANVENKSPIQNSDISSSDEFSSKEPTSIKPFDESSLPVEKACHFAVEKAGHYSDKFIKEDLLKITNINAFFSQTVEDSNNIKKAKDEIMVSRILSNNYTSRSHFDIKKKISSLDKILKKVAIYDVENKVETIKPADKVKMVDESQLKTGTKVAIPEKIVSVTNSSSMEMKNDLVFPCKVSDMDNSRPLNSLIGRLKTSIDDNQSDIALHSTSAFNVQTSLKNLELLDMKHDFDTAFTSPTISAKGISKPTLRIRPSHELYARTPQFNEQVSVAAVTCQEPSCSFKDSSHQRMSHHTFLVHQKFSCFYCEFSTRFNKDFDLHTSSVHQIGDFKCPQNCFDTVFSCSEFIRHASSLHKNEEFVLPIASSHSSCHEQISPAGGDFLKIQSYGTLDRVSASQMFETSDGRHKETTSKLSVEVKKEPSSSYEKMMENVPLEPPTIPLQCLFTKYQDTDIFQLYLSTKSFTVFKCMSRGCSFDTQLPDEFLHHLVNDHGIDQEWRCCYCLLSKNTQKDLVAHVQTEHGHCEYQCKYCLYRAYSKIYLGCHVKRYHPELPARYFKVITSNTKVPINLSFETFVYPYRCSFSNCSFRTVDSEVFVQHSKVHGGPDLICYFCEFSSPVRQLIQHMHIHEMNEFQCPYCLCGESERDKLLAHLVNVHPGQHGKVLVRKQVSAPSVTAFASKKEHTSTSAPSVADTFSDKKQLSASAPSAADTISNKEQLSASAPSVADTISHKEQLSASAPSVADTVSNKELSASAPSVADTISNKEQLLSASAPSVAVTDLNKEQFSLNKDQSFVNKDQEYFPTPIIASKEVSTPVSQLAIPSTIDTNTPTVSHAIFGQKQHSPSMVIGTSLSAPNSDDFEKSDLMGSDLYRCGNEKCTFSCATAVSLKEHLQICDFSRDSPLLKCFHCSKHFRHLSGLLEHMKIHGFKRYICGIERCLYRSSLANSFKQHMKQDHHITTYKIVPKDLTNKNPETQEFIVYSKDSQIAIRDPHKKRKNEFSTEDIERIPMAHVSYQELKCYHCLYSTKIRMNLVKHLQLHKTRSSCFEIIQSDLSNGQNLTIPFKQPINPVPRLEGKELMFDKMINMAGSSVGGKRKLENALRAQHPIPQEELNNLPSYVPDEKVNCCGYSTCKYLSCDEVMLKYHIETLHSDVATFSCPHCPDYLLTAESFVQHYKLHGEKLYRCGWCCRLTMRQALIERHLKDEHPINEPFFFTIRGAEVEEADVGKEDTVRMNQDLKWGCCLCPCYRVCTKAEIINHMNVKHDTQCQYKCGFCFFKSSDQSAFEGHYSTKHPEKKELTVHCLFFQIGSDEIVPIPQGGNTSSHEPIWKRNDPNRIKNIRGILFEDENDEKTYSLLDIEPGEPFNDEFVCPKCRSFKNSCCSTFRSHLCKEACYQRFECKECGITSPLLPSLRRHYTKIHNAAFSVDCYLTLPVDSTLESWVESIILHQSQSIKEWKESVGLHSKTPSPSKQAVRRSSNEGQNPSTELKAVTISSPEKNKLMCTLCSMVCKSSQGLKLHTKLMHHAKQKCSLCSYSCTNESSLKTHVANKHPIIEDEETLKVTITSEPFNNESDKTPMTSTPSNKDADKTVKVPIASTDEVSTMNKISKKEAEKNVGILMTSKSYKEAKIIKPSKELFKCRHCDFKCHSSKMFYAHNKTHPEFREYLCVYCNERFESSGSGNRHHKFKHSDKPLKIIYQPLEGPQETQESLPADKKEENCIAKSLLLPGTSKTSEPLPSDCLFYTCCHCSDKGEFTYMEEHMKSQHRDLPFLAKKQDPNGDLHLKQYQYKCGHCSHQSFSLVEAMNHWMKNHVTLEFKFSLQLTESTLIQRAAKEEESSSSPGSSSNPLLDSPSNPDSLFSIEETTTKSGELKCDIEHNEVSSSTSDIGFSCGFCPETCISESQITHHLSTMHEGKAINYTKVQQNKTFNVRKVSRSPRADHASSFRCDICVYQVITEKAINLHMMKRHSDKLLSFTRLHLGSPLPSSDSGPLICDHCEELFQDPRNHHLLIHTNLLPKFSGVSTEATTVAEEPSPPELLVRPPNASRIKSTARKSFSQSLPQVPPRDVRRIATKSTSGRLKLAIVRKREVSPVVEPVATCVIPSTPEPSDNATSPSKEEVLSSSGDDNTIFTHFNLLGDKPTKLTVNQLASLINLDPKVKMPLAMIIGGNN